MNSDTWCFNDLSCRIKPKKTDAELKKMFPDEDRIDSIGQNGNDGLHYSHLDDPSDSSHNNGGTTDYYKLDPKWKDVIDIIESRDLNYSQGNILKVGMTLNTGRHEGTDYERELNKVIFFANREKERIKK